MLTTRDIQRATQRCFDAYETGDPDAVLETCTEDIAFWDTESEGVLKGREAVRSHLARLLGRFDMRFVVLEEHRLEGRDAAMVMWQCALRRRDAAGRPGEALVMQRGMKLFEVRGDRISRDESYMDIRHAERALAEATTEREAA